jgi:transcription elongation factor GreA
VNSPPPEQSRGGLFFLVPGSFTMLDEIRSRIEAEIATLMHELNVVLPKAIKTAVEHGDLRENADYKSALERQQFVQARLNQLTKRMGELSKIDPAAMPFDRVGFGSRVKIYDVAMKEEKDLTIVAGDFMDLDSGQVSLASPIGRGLLGAKEGQEVTIRLPIGERKFKILELQTLPQQMGMAGKK